MPARPPAPALDLSSLPPRWQTDLRMRSYRTALAEAEVIGDAAGLLLITRAAGGHTISGYGPQAAGRAYDLLRDGGLDPLVSLDLPRDSRFTAAACAELGLVAQPGWDWLCTEQAPTAPSWAVDDLDPASDQEAILTCLADSNPDTDAVPGAADDAGWWGVTVDGRLLGVIGASRRDGSDPARDSWHLHGLGVRPEARRRGVGAALTAAATRAGFAAGTDWVSLGVWADNAGAIAIYHRLGFQTQHQRGSYLPVHARPQHVC